MTYLLKLDSDNRVVGYRSGPYSKSDMHEGEILISDNSFNVEQYQYSVFNPKTKEFIFDDIYTEYQQSLQNPPPVEPDPVPIDPALAYDEDAAARYVQNILDEKAREYLYDNIFTAATYINSTIEKFRNEAAAFIEWRDRVWIWAYTKLDKIKTGEIEKPPFNELFVDMPQFVPPVVI